MQKLTYELKRDEVFAKYKTKAEGLSDDEARARLLKNGPNELLTAKPKSRWAMFWGQFKDLMLIILLIAALVTGIIAFATQNYTDLIDVGVILAIVFINAIIGFIQENNATKAIESLKHLTQPTTKVKRNGKIIEIPTSQVVVGDILYIEGGDIVCADCYLIECDGLKCNESSLTGESLDVVKKVCEGLPAKTSLSERTNMIYSGSTVSYGHAYGVVVATGMDTEIGKIAHMINNQSEEMPHIQKKLKSLSRVLTYIILVISLIVFCIDYFVPSPRTIEDSLLIAIALAVAAIPESLPAVITIIMTRSVARLSKRRAIVKKMHTIETLGACQVICTDKTGTITENKIELNEVYFSNKMLNSKNWGKIKDTPLALAMALCNDCVVSNGKLVGDSVDVCMVKSMEKLKLDFTKTVDTYPKLHEFPFDSTRNLLTTYHPIWDNVIGFSRGIPDIVLSHCDYVYVDGERQKLTDAIRENLLKTIESMCKRGMRCIGFSYHEHKASEFTHDEENSQTFLGITGLRDPPRSTSATSVAECQAAGIKVIMISGDHPTTAQAIASEVGIFHKGDQILSGPELDELSDEQFDQVVQNTTVYAKATPANKLRIIAAWQRLGNIVAMTGDGVNDAPSIKAADIGVGMGKGGTQVAKEAADIILTDDNFSTVVTAVSEGRRIYDNIKKVIQFLLGTNFVEVLSILLITFICPQLGFLSAIQILLINLITDSLPALSLSVEPAEHDAMTRKPNPSDDNLFAGIKIPMIVQVIWQTACVVISFILLEYLTGDNTLAITFSFVILSLSQIFHLINVRSKESIFKSNPFHNKLFWFTFITSIIINFAIINIGFLANIFEFKALSPLLWLIAFGVSFSIIPVMEIYKFIKSKCKKNN
ncbi:MAG: cation-translocating P-type ATPase [Clostridia bacterium]|nr:cation-translocating P-type ATPase [Clostridia bacterium]